MLGKMNHYKYFFAFSFLLQWQAKGSHAEDVERTKVLILGAGMAGVEAAKTLHENGITDILILEASDRIGGRMLHKSFGDTTVELGAVFIHDIVGNPVYDLAKKYNISGKKPDFSQLTVLDDRCNDITRQAFKELGKIQDATTVAKDIARDKFRNNKSDISFRTGLQLGMWNPKTALQHAVDYSQFDAIEAERPDILSLKYYYGDLESTNDENQEDFEVVDSRGYAHIAERELQQILTPNDKRLRLRETVSKIVYNNKGVRVRTTNDKIYIADYAIVTFSLGVLQQGNITFLPPLPDWKREILYKFRMRTLTKVYLKFSRNFWSNSEAIIHSNERRGYWSVWINAEYDDKRPVGTNVLMGFVTGDEADRVQRMSDAAVKSEVMTVLRSMYGLSIPQPEEILVTKWPDSPLFYGSYIAWPFGVTKADHVGLRKELGRLHFAGSSYHPTDNGMVHGAYKTGIEEAQRISDIISSTIK